jgi:hypothetical protein
MAAGRLGSLVKTLRAAIGREAAVATLNALTTAVPEFVPSVFARELARQNDLASALTGRRSRRIRELPRARYRAA